MSHSRTLAACAFAIASSMVSNAALADIPPPRDYVEGCTVERVQKPGERCSSCSAWHGERDACEKSLGKAGYEHRCSTLGASVWSEIWCKSAAKPDGPAAASSTGFATPPPATTASPTTATPAGPPAVKPAPGGCAAHGAPRASTAWLAAALLTLTVLLRRRGA